MTAAPEWVQQARSSGTVDDTTMRLLNSPHWGRWARAVDPSLRPAVLESAAKIALIDVDHAQIPAALAQLEAEGVLTDIAARTGGGGERIATNALEAAFSLHLADRPITASDFIVRP